MNFYKRHLGDLAKSCSDLSQGQMGAYDLLTDWHYANEKPLPLDKDKLYRIGRAVTKAERQNVDTVIAEMFTKTETGYTQKRAIEEMAKAAAQGETNRRIAVEREERKRARNEHEACNEIGNESYNESSTKRQPSHKPLTISHKELDSSKQAQRTLTSPTDAGLACRLMREKGCIQTNPSHVDLVAALAEGITPQTLADCVAEAIEAGKPKPFAWAIATARGRHAEGAKQITTGESHGNDRSQTGTGRKLSVVEQVERNIRERREREATDIDGESKRIGAG